MSKPEKDVGVLAARGTRRVALTAGRHALLPTPTQYSTAPKRRAKLPALPRTAGWPSHYRFTGVLNRHHRRSATTDSRRAPSLLRDNLVARFMTRDAIIQLAGGAIDLAF